MSASLPAPGPKASPRARQGAAVVVGQVGPAVVEAVQDLPGAFCDTVVQCFGDRPRPRFTLVLSGGPTAQRCYEALASLPAGTIDWSVVDVLIGDERHVPADHPDANQAMIRRALVDQVGGVGSFRPMPTAMDPASDAQSYNTLAARVLAGDGVDLIHLGMGPDGHTASLFPGCEALEAADDQLVAPVVDPSGTNPHPRLSLTLPAIAAARLAVFTVSGAASRQALADILAGADLPAARVRATEVRWLVDAEAAGEQATPGSADQGRVR